MVRPLLIALIAATVVLGACSSDDADPASIIDAYVTAYNAGDMEGVMALFSEDSVVSNHPFTGESSGLTEISSLHLADLEAAATENAYTISNVEVTGNTVTWDHLWINREGDQFCQSGQTAVIEAGKILTWTWPVDDFNCP